MSNFETVILAGDRTSETTNSILRKAEQMVNEDLVEVADSGELLSASQIIDRMWSNAVKNVTYKHVSSGHNRAQTMEPKRLEQLVIEMARENTKNNA